VDSYGLVMGNLIFYSFVEGLQLSHSGGMVVWHGDMERLDREAFGELGREGIFC
jgi:hypothetical protein